MSVFSDEWRKCLREQYKYVIRNDDRVTLNSLLSVMDEVGFNDRELAELRVEATMRVEDNPEDFVPDLALLESFQPHPLECQCPACITVNMVPHNEEGQPLDKEELAELAEKQKKDDPDKPKQLSLF